MGGGGRGEGVVKFSVHLNRHVYVMRNSRNENKDRMFRSKRRTNACKDSKCPVLIHYENTPIQIY